MEFAPSPAAKYERLYFETYMGLVHNAVGSRMFNNFYLRAPEGDVIDATSGGLNSCAFFVSSLLVIVGKISDIHGTVLATVEDLQESGWQQEAEEMMEPGDVLVWRAMPADDGTWRRHLGFYVGSGWAVSNSSRLRMVTTCRVDFEGSLGIERVFRYPWQHVPSFA